MTRVLLNVYDLDPFSSTINEYTLNWSIGAFHVGVELFVTEYAFGFTEDASETGIVRCKPRMHPAHVYRDTIDMGICKFSKDQVDYIVEHMKPDWNGASYHLLRKNCINFADQFCCLLGVGSVPCWIKNLQNGASRAADRIETTALQIKQFDDKLGLSSSLNKIRELEIPSEIGKAAGYGWQAVTGGIGIAARLIGGRNTQTELQSCKDSVPSMNHSSESEQDSKM